MMAVFVRVVLLGCAMAGFAGAGVSAAVRRYRSMQEVPDEDGFAAIAAILFLVGMLCADLGGGPSAIAAIGVPAGFASYVIAAHRLSIFRIETGATPIRIPAETELHT